MSINELVAAMTAVIQIRKSAVYLQGCAGLTNQMRQEIVLLYEHAEALEGLLLDAAGPSGAGQSGGVP